MSDEQFYQDGLQFECTGCGACCNIHGDYAYAYLTTQNVDEISAYLGMKPIDFLNTYCAKDENGNVHLTIIDGHCIFLEDKKCIVYSVRPIQCRAWPILTEHLNDECWNGALREFCPGIGKGKRYTKEEIENIAKSRDKAYDLT